MQKKIITFFVCIFIALLSCAGAANAESSLSAGYKAYQDGDFERAIKYLKSINKKDAILSDYALYYLGETYLSLNRFDDALTTFDAVTANFAASPLAPSALEKMGDVHLLKGDAAGSIDAYKGFLAKYPKSAQTPEVVYELVTALLSGSRQDEAIPFIKRLLIEFPQTEYQNSPYSQLWDDEIKRLNADEFYSRVKALYNARLYKKIVNEIEEYVVQGPQCISCKDTAGYHNKLRLLMGQSLYQARDYKKAKEVFKGVIVNSDDETMRAESLIWIARCSIRVKDFNSAKDILKVFLDVYPASVLKDEAMYRLAMIAKDESDTDQAVIFLRQLSIENPRSFYRADALWQISWIQYKQGNFEESLKTLKLLEDTPLKMRSLYWQGKISLLMGQKDEAVQLFIAAAHGFPLTYYSVMGKKALEAIGNSAPFTPVSFHKNKNGTLKNKREESLPFQRARRLLDIGLTNLALKELASVDVAQNPLEISLLYQEAGDYFHSYAVARGRMNGLSASFPLELSFPQGYKESVVEAADRHEVDPLLIYSVMMQESEFDQKAVSNAGAIGLLQIMPFTGEMIARKLSHKSFKPDDLFEPSLNIRFGAWYLKSLIERFKGNLLFAVAAYNAGPNAVDEWIKRWDEVSMDDFLENIPYQETRKYAEKILGYYETYKAIYTSQPQAHPDNQTAKDGE